ncbi:hypothetical protein GCK72_010043 [Caenorhabditis remanei]|uniref:Piwi domain-containing protein n=1 Tax=Caenorhabditis remanei TaxID=31234 RepID=A0A6A5H3L3_CAERE|nr:hypothetical protein GCK72_010043 [Caenorhabditis remanei]KAF1761787.1 hypothetical protein GCK72_010043 [Caenorhabditis remanei]
MLPLRKTTDQYGVLPPPAVPPPNATITSDSRTTNEACIARLQQLQLQPFPKIYPTTKLPGNRGSSVDIQTNVFGIEIQKRSDIFQYSVSIKTDLTSSKEVVFTKKGKEDFVVRERHEKCCSILMHAFDRYSEFFRTNENTLIYDGQSMMYSTFDLFQESSDGETKTKLLPINGNDTNHEDLKSLPYIKLEVHATKNPPVKFSQEDIGRRSSDSRIDSIHGAYHHILELALNQSCIRDFTRCMVFENGKIFFVNPLKEGFSRDDFVDVGDGKQMMPGIKKTVQFIEGPYGRGQSNPSVVIDGMKVAFHKEQPLNEKIREIISKNFTDCISDFERERCVAVIKGLDCYTTHAKRVRHLTIEGIHHEGARKSRFQLKDGGASTVAEYFRDHYKIELRYPNANLVVCKERGNLNFYPMELVFISPNQRVKISQQTSAQSQKTTKESAVLPDVRQRIIMTGKIAAKISSDSKYLNEFGLSVCDEPLMVTGRILPPVKLEGRTSSNMLPIKDNKWRLGQYARPAQAPKVWAMYAVGLPSSRFTPALLSKFGDEFSAMCRSKGIEMPALGDIDLVLAQDIEKKLSIAADAGCTFVYIITDDAITNLHHMKMSKAHAVVSQGKKLTLENIVNKTNMKLGGNNYIFTDSKKYLDDILVIGVGISQPPPGNKFILEGKGLLNPMVIGFAHNGKEKQEFSGDFVLSPAGQDTLVVVEEVLKQSISGYQKWHDGQCPKRIIMYRSGVSEGSQGNVIAYELPLIRSTIDSFSKKIQFVYIAVSKDHSYRFFKSNLNTLTKSNTAISKGQQSSVTGSRSAMPAAGAPKAWDLNIAPGIIVDSVITNPACSQFFLNSHITLQGSAKTPLYTVLSDDTHASMASLEELTYNLCHLHQIVGLPTSLPTPLYVANEYAKRGRNLWNEAYSRNPVPRGTGSESELLQELSNAINYKAFGSFLDRRVNA